MKSVTLKDFSWGTINSIEAISIPDTASSKALNWTTASTKIALRGGYFRIGDTNNVTGPITGLIVAKNVGLSATTETIFRKRGRKLEYYDLDTDDWIENGTDVFPVAGEDEHVSMQNYHSITGSQLHINAPLTGPFKVIVANPADITDLYDSAKNFKGHIRVKQNRTFLWNRGGTTKDSTGLYGSYLDKDEATSFTAITLEAIGALGATVYTGTLAFKAGDAQRTCFEVTFTDGTELFTDNLDGTLTGDQGGTGTINYTTGAYDITFAATTTVAVTADYRWEDSTSEGIVDFTKSTPRTAGQGFIFRQDTGGGKFQAIEAIGGTEYCMHESKTWALTLSTDDTEATNLTFRDRVGIPNFRASIETGDGVYYIDDTDSNDTHLRLMSFDSGGSEVIPKSVSKRLKYNNEKIGFSFSGYTFDQAATIEWGDYIVFACRTEDSSVNNRVFTYNKQTGAIDEHDYFVTCFAIYNGKLIAGDSVSGNVSTLFNGLDDDDSIIGNYWEGSLSNLSLERLKKQKKIVVQGEIGTEQGIKVSCSIDRGDFTEIGTILGSGTYVDTTNRVVVGAQLIGDGTIGGDTDGVEAYNYMREMSMPVGNFELIKLRFEAIGLGYASVSTIEHKDIRQKWHRIPNKYR